MNIGSSAFVNAEIPNLDHVYVNIGLGNHLEMSKQEAISYADNRIQLNSEKEQALSLAIAEKRVEIQDNLMHLQKSNF